MTRSRDLPSEEDLQEHRAIRDRGWRSVRAAWLHGEDPDPEFMAAFGEDGHLADRYEKSVKRADDTSDILREEADAVAQADHLRNAIRETDADLSEGKRRHDELQGKRDEIRDQWRDLWSPLGVSPLSPRRNAGMVRQGERAETQGRGTAKKRHREADVLRKSVQASSSELASALSAANVKASENAGYCALLSLARHTLDKNGESRQGPKKHRGEHIHLAGRDRRPPATDGGDREGTPPVEGTMGRSRLKAGLRTRRGTRRRAGIHFRPGRHLPHDRKGEGLSNTPRRHRQRLREVSDKSEGGDRRAFPRLVRL